MEIKRRHQHEPLVEHHTSEGTPIGTYRVTRGTRGNKPSSHRFAHRLHDVWFLLFVLLLMGGIVFALARAGAAVEQQANTTQVGTFPARTASVMSQTPTPTVAVIMRTARVRLYPFPASKVGLMQPSVDAQGNVWVGEMYGNRIARLHSRNGVITTWEPSDAKNGIMSTTVDAQSNPWFVEQGANYLGRFDSGRQTFRIFPLGTINGHPLGPQSLQFDASGNLWFTAVTAGRIGRLDPTTGAIQTWPVPAPCVGIPSFPFSLTLSPDGQVWFGFLTGGAVGRLDPVTGHVTLYHLADPQAQVFSMAHDARGRIWFTEIVPGKLGSIDPTTNKVTELNVPMVLGRSAALYGIGVTDKGDVWFANNGANALVRYTPDNAQFIFFQLPGPSGGLYGLTLDKASTLWFTMSDSSANAVGEMAP